MNTDKIYAESIANEYAKKDEKKVVALKKLDKKAKRSSNIFAYTFGIISALVLGVGMCLSMKVIGDGSTLTMAAGIVAALPGISELSPLYLACTVAAVAGGSTVCSHFNDSGFWLVRSLVGIDEKTTLKTWTIMETLVGVTGFLVALVISFFA